jgi:AraC family transcriptional regulator, regulatory protein of adaptative response / DNA-3-methyladenine glycosylase II
MDLTPSLPDPAAGRLPAPDACYRAFAARDARFDGKVFVGVRTTGIYCRPVCPARTPKRENMCFYPSAAAAQEAGFRPCLRCRPEASPDMGAWRGTSASVSRALALIEAGALDEGDVEALALRLGLGGRQLRRLFRQHLGASPVAVAQTRRVLLAKQLIQETRLPMTDVALASGFGSVRRFNETFQTLFARPPGALRRTSSPGGEGGDAAAGGPVELRLAARAPFDLAGLLAFLAPRALMGIEQVEQGAYARTIRTPGGAGVIRITGDGPAHVRVRLWLASLADLPGVIARVRRFLDLSADPVQIGAHLAEDPLLAPLVAARPGLRVPGSWDPFEAAVRAILGQQVTVGHAIALVQQLALRHGSPLPTGAGAQLPGLHQLFPAPHELAGQDLSWLPVPRARSAALEGLARACAQDPALLQPGASLAETTDRLVALPGIGPWTACYIALRAYGEPDAFLEADAGVQQALSRLTGTRPTARQALEQARRWSPWRAYATAHLWASLSDPALPVARLPPIPARTTPDAA